VPHLETACGVDAAAAATDWLWLHGHARAAFLGWRSARDGAPAPALVLRIWRRAGPCPTLDAARALAAKFGGTDLQGQAAPGDAAAPSQEPDQRVLPSPGTEGGGGWAMDMAATAAALTHLGADGRCAPLARLPGTWQL